MNDKLISNDMSLELKKWIINSNDYVIRKAADK